MKKVPPRQVLVDAAIWFLIVFAAAVITAAGCQGGPEPYPEIECLQTTDGRGHGSQRQGEHPPCYAADAAAD